MKIIINGKEHEVLSVTRENVFGHVYCPINGWDCPYFNEKGYCMIYPDADPAEECDDFYSVWGTDKDYVCFN